MLHWMYFISRRPDLSRDEFFTYWRKRHVRAIPEPIPEIRRYLQSHSVLDPRGDAPYEGIAEVWADSLDSLQRLLNSSPFAMLLKDEPNFIDLNQVEYLTTNDRVEVDGERRPGMVRGVWLSKRKPGMTVAEYRRYWHEVHVPMALKLPGVRRYVRSETIDEVYRLAEPKWDGVANLWFDDAAAAHRFLQSDEYLKGTMPDGEKFVSSASAMWVQEHLIIWPT